jgi:hypothetical protein
LRKTRVWRYLYQLHQLSSSHRQLRKLGRELNGLDQNPIQRQKDKKGRTDRDAVGEKDDVRIRGGGRQRRSFTLSASDAEEDSRPPKQARISSDRIFRIPLKSELAKATGIKANEDVQRTEGRRRSTTNPSHGPVSSTEARDIIEQVVSEGNVPWEFKWRPVGTLMSFGSDASNLPALGSTYCRPARGYGSQLTVMSPVYRQCTNRYACCLRGCQNEDESEDRT